jgi:hypothetical protein
MSNQLSNGPGLSPGEPLWRRVPSRDNQGRALFDFMMLIPKLGKASEIRRQQVMLELQSVLERFGDEVVFADLNLKTSLLWVSIKPRQGAMLEFSSALRARIPEALLIANQADILLGEALRAERQNRWRRWGLKLLR